MTPKLKNNPFCYSARNSVASLLQTTTLVYAKILVFLYAYTSRRNFITSATLSVYQATFHFINYFNASIIGASRFVYCTFFTAKKVPKKLFAVTPKLKEGGVLIRQGEFL
ncbi:MAG: hypothetical protein PUC14_03975 [Bacteroidales bacterium]|nr:hypothetical protein [Bacteroidales bacterium]